MGMEQYLIPFLGGWTSIYQLFWCELQGYIDTLPDVYSTHIAPIKIAMFTSKDSKAQRRLAVIFVSRLAFLRLQAASACRKLLGRRWCERSSSKQWKGSSKCPGWNRGGSRVSMGKKIMHLNDATGFKGKEWDFMGNSNMWFDDV